MNVINQHGNKPKENKEKPTLIFRLGDKISRFVNSVLIRRGRIPVIHAFTSYGSTKSIRVLGRAVIVKRYDSPLSIYRGIKSLLVAEVPNVEVEAKIDGKIVPRKIITDRNGYIDSSFRLSLPPGEHKLSFSIVDDMYYKAQQESELSKGKLLIYPDSSNVGVICDVDDTIIRSDLTGWVRAIWLALFSNPREREPVEGMNTFLRNIQQQFLHSKFFYVSTTAWNMSYYIKRFLVANAFPFGPLVLRDWGPEEDRVFASGVEHKMVSIKSLFRRFPNTQWILIGDNGQKDCKIYSKILETFPNKVQAVFIRKISRTENKQTFSKLGNRIEFGFDGYELKKKFLAMSEELVKILV
jgi:phosphatidate phosphatase APP1